MKSFFSMVLSLLFLGASLGLSQNVQAAYSFGYNGTNGNTGSSGVNGRSGQDVKLFANGSAQNLSLNGSSGSDGYPGSYGQDAYNCSVPVLPDYDLQGADGGDAGNGGRGGDAGSGGDVILYYTNIANLKNIYISSIPGQPGRGSYSGQPGRGCYCGERSWTKQECRIVTKPDGSQVRECTNRYYTCNDGRTGTYGQNGFSGGNGSYGSLTLINSATELLPNYTRDSVSVANINGAKFSLAYNKFETLSGAIALLASGSVLNDRYGNFVGRIVVTADFTWKASRPESDFSGATVFVSHSGTEVNASFSDGLWLDYTKTINGNNKSFVITQALKESEAKMVAFSMESSTYKEAFVRIKDTAPNKEFLTDEFTIEIWRKTVFGNRDSQFSGTIAKADMIVDGNDLLIPVHKLALKEPKKTLGKNNEVYASVAITRSYLKYSTQVLGEVSVKLPKK